MVIVTALVAIVMIKLMTYLLSVFMSSLMVIVLRGRLLVMIDGLMHSDLVLMMINEFVAVALVFVEIVMHGLLVEMHWLDDTMIIFVVRHLMPVTVYNMIKNLMRV